MRKRSSRPSTRRKSAAKNSPEDESIAKRSFSRKSASRKSAKVRSHFPSLQLVAIPGLPEILPGDNLANLIVAAARRARISFQNGDVLVIAQKIVSKSENRLANLRDVTPSPKAQQLAATLKKDPRLIQVILSESRRIVRSHPVLIVETRHGLVCANAGVDQSNIPGDDIVSLLPRDPDNTARKLAARLRRVTRKEIAVIISDTFGRPWRLGLINVAIGAAGVPVLLDLRGSRDHHGKPLHATIIAVADELATAAGLLMVKSAATPAILIRGYHYHPANNPAARIIRPAREDLFR
jgi:coenzyme F420-0:L-glutamate ligase/coenzyme F420-1:gamma-L-glutamate ligase